MSGFYDNPIMVPTDEARRASDVVMGHLAAHGLDAVGKWVAIRLSDGGSDGNLYDNKSDAIRFQLHEKQCVYTQLLPEGMSIRAAQAFINVHRQFYEAGMNMADPDRQVEIPQREETWKHHGLTT